MRFLKVSLGALVASVAASVVLAGCASVPTDRGGSVATDLLKSRSALAASVAVARTVVDPQAEVTNILSKPIDADDAVRVALMQSPRMRNLYSELGLAQADVYDATRLSNPVLGYSNLAGSGHAQTTWSVSQSFTELLFIGYRSRIGRSQLLQAQQRVARDVLALEAAVRAQYYRAVGANLVAQMRERAAETTQLSAQYARQLFDAGNISALQLSREQAAAAAADIDRRQSTTEVLAARAALMNLMGLSVTDARVTLIEQLPLPTTLTMDVKNLQTWALQNRLDLATAREAVAMWTANATHTRRWRWLGGVAFGYEIERDVADTTIKGPTASFEVPLFNQGGSRLLRARAGLEIEMTKVAALELTIGNDIVIRHAAVQSAAAIVEQYRQSVVPLHERIVELTQQQQNFMLIGAFELLATKQQEIDIYQSYLESVRDYWIEHAELMHVAGGSFPDSDTKTQGAVGAGIDGRAAQEASGDSTAAPIDHSGHQMPAIPSTAGDKP
jgi:cobalt-zinc-cadmium efflux system outer membrane protein